MKKLRLALTGIALSLGFQLAAHAQTTTLRYAVGFPSGASTEAARVYADAVKRHTDNSVNLRVFDLSLLNLAEMSAGLEKGLTDIGNVMTQYNPADFPHMNMASELSMMLALQGVADNKLGLAFAGALSEYVFLHCPECNADFARRGQVFGGAGASSPYMLLCTKPIRSQEDLKGARLRTGGAAWARWARQIGATPVSMPANEMFEALKQKVVECTMISPTELSGMNLKEVVSDITTDLPGGVFAGSNANMNVDRWRKLSEDQRRGMLRASAVLTADATMRYHVYGKRDLELAASKGVRFHKVDSATLKASQSLIEADLVNVATLYAQQHKVAKAAEMVAKMRPLVARWSKLVEPINDATALADLYWQEVYSKVDVKTHGMPR